MHPLYRLTVSKPDKDLFISTIQSFEDCFKDAIRLMRTLKEPIPQTIQDHYKDKDYFDKVTFSQGEYKVTIVKKQ